MFLGNSKKKQLFTQSPDTTSEPVKNVTNVSSELKEKKRSRKPKAPGNASSSNYTFLYEDRHSLI